MKTYQGMTDRHHITFGQFRWNRHLMCCLITIFSLIWIAILYIDCITDYTYWFSIYKMLFRVWKPFNNFYRVLFECVLLDLYNYLCTQCVGIILHFSCSASGFIHMFVLHTNRSKFNAYYISPHPWEPNGVQIIHKCEEYTAIYCIQFVGSILYVTQCVSDLIRYIQGQ